MQKIIFLFLSGIIALFSWQLHYCVGGYTDNDKLMNQISIQTNINNQLLIRNNNESIKLNALKGSLDALEGKIRKQFNMTHPDETLIILPNNYMFKKLIKINAKK